MKYSLIFSLVMTISSPVFTQSTQITGHDYVELSQEFLNRMRAGEDASEIVDKYAKIDFNALVEAVDERTEKLAFWINTYNGFVQYLLVNDPSLFEDRRSFYFDKRVNIAGIKMSFDDIEHGIIRDSRVKLGLGFLKKWFVPKYERMLRVDDRDGRVHFALNCGAKSCPPVAIYDDQFIYAQLDEITESYLKKETVVEKNKVTTSILFSWFRGDFGGKKGIKQFLKKYGIIESTKGVEVHFGNYDWTLSTGNYTDFQKASPTVK
ncbi:MAG: DUF547 domain-containing protein [Bacteroidetes bacterium]|nr:MAG: DUF547 domain-containing protein [Bacteroidota bacterium]